jgi:hypothetical protein
MSDDETKAKLPVIIKFTKSVENAAVKFISCAFPHSVESIT